MIERGKAIPNIGLFMEPGLGKSITALTIVAESKPGKTLVIAPLRVAESVWAQEAAKWEHTQHLRVAKIMGSAKQRVSALESDADIYLTNVDNVAWLVENWVDGKFDYLIIDESSRFKDPSTKRFKAIKKVIKQFKKVIIATGTPAPQGYQDLWSQVGLLDQGARLEKSLTKFRITYMEPEQKNWHTNTVYKWKLKKGAADVIEKLIGDICFSLKAEDYLQLPKLTNLYHEIVLPKEAMKKYGELREEMVTHIKGEEITAVSAAVLSNKLLQFTSGMVYDENRDTNFVHDTKLDYLESIIEESSEPTLIFYHYKHSLERLLARFSGSEVLTDGNMERWRQGSIKVLLAHPQSGGIGLNLQCNTGKLANMVWYDLPWSSENYIQANARIYRQGQTKPVMVHHLLAKDTIDNHVVKVLDGKINIQDALLESLKSG